MIECVTFMLADQNYAIDIKRVREVCEREGIRDVPGGGFDFTGVLEIRGKIVPVFDLRLILNLGPTEPNDENAVIVVKAGPERVGFMVDAVTDIERLSPESKMLDDSYKKMTSAEFVSAVFSVNNDVTIMIDVDSILAAKSHYPEDFTVAADESAAAVA